MTQFYCDALGLAVQERATDEESHYSFLTDRQPVPGTPSGMHHRLVLRQSRSGKGRGLAEATRLDHFAWEVDDEAELWSFVQRLRAMGCETDLQEAQIAWQCYVHDPEGNRLEVYCDRRERPGGSPLWQGRQEELPEATLRQAAR